MRQRVSVDWEGSISEGAGRRTLRRLVAGLFSSFGGMIDTHPGGGGGGPRGARNRIKKGGNRKNF